jgi:hypothetical protein
MNEDDIQILAFAEKNADPNSWNMPIFYEGNCLIGCKGRKLSRTRNLFAAGSWVEYHRESPEHISLLLSRSGGDIEKLPEIKGNILLCENVDKETQP